METNDRKQRQVRSLPQNFKTRDADGKLYIEGYFAVFDSPYPLWDGAEEVVKPGAFEGVLTQDVRALVNHDTRHAPAEAGRDRPLGTD